MIHSNVSPSANGPERSPFASAQSALARKPMPGPPWAWAGLAALAACGLAYLVTPRGPAEHRPHPAHEAAANAEPEAPSAQPAAAAGDSKPTALAEAPASAAPSGVAATDAPAKDGAAADAPAKDGAAADAPAKDAAAVAGGEATPAKADESSQAVASAAPVTKKKGRGAHGSSRKRAVRAH